MKLDYERIGERIKKRRKILGISQAQLAETVDLATKYISQIERGIRHLSLDTIVNIAAALDVSVDTLLFGARFITDEKSACQIKSFNDYSKNEQDAILELLSVAKIILLSHNIIV